MGGNDNQLFKCNTFREHCIYCKLEKMTTEKCLNAENRIYEALEIIHTCSRLHLTMF